MKAPPRKTTRWQIISSTTIIWVTIAIIAILVNGVPNFKYQDNIFMLMEFNKFCVIWILLGGIGLVFLIDPNIYTFGLMSCLHSVNNKSKLFGLVFRMVLTITGVLLVLSPAIGGIILSTTTETGAGETTGERYRSTGEIGILISSIKL